MTSKEEKEQWLELRREGLGGSDIANVIGIGFGNPYSVFLDKLNLSENQENESMKWGILHEPTVAEEYQRRHPEVEVVDTGLKIFRHPDHDWMLVTPDRICIPKDGSPSYGLEVKTTSAFMKKHWGDEGSDDIPDMYIVQNQWGMSVTGHKRWDTAVLIGGNKYREYTQVHNPKLAKTLIKKGKDFWEIHVKQESPPEIDGTIDSLNFLKKWFPDHNEDLLPMTGDMLVLLKNRAMNISLMDSYEEKKIESETKIVEAIGASLGFEGDSAKVTFKKTKDSDKTAWKALALDLLKALPDMAQAEFLGRHTEHKEGYRKLRIDFKVEEE